MRTTLEGNELMIYMEGHIDSGNAHEFESQLFAALDANSAADPSLDAEKLEYISSAGLRVLMRVRKRVGHALPILNVSPDVYSVFEMTGFTELMDVRKRLREVSIEGCPVVGQGATATVYRLDPDTVVKVFRPNVAYDTIVSENEHARNAFLSGIPSAIAYDIVRVGDSFGCVYELLDAEDFISVLRRDKENLAEHMGRFAQAMRKMHEVEVDASKFTPTKQGTLAVLPGLVAAGVITEEELGEFQRLYASIPDRFTFVHGDCHPGNVMVQNGQFVFIDTMTSGCGHPIFDLCSMCSVYRVGTMLEEGQMNPLVKGFSPEEQALMWDTYLRSYLQSDDEQYIRRVENQVIAVCCARTLLAVLFIPGLLSPKRIEFLKKIVLDYCAHGVEPIEF